MSGLAKQLKNLKERFNSFVSCRQIKRNIKKTFAQNKVNHQTRESTLTIINKRRLNEIPGHHDKQIKSKTFSNTTFSSETSHPYSLINQFIRLTMIPKLIAKVLIIQDQALEGLHIFLLLEGLFFWSVSNGCHVYSNAIVYYMYLLFVFCCF